MSCGRWKKTNYIWLSMLYAHKKIYLICMTCRGCSLLSHKPGLIKTGLHMSRSINFQPIDLAQYLLDRILSIVYRVYNFWSLSKVSNLECIQCLTWDARSVVLHVYSTPTSDFLRMVMTCGLNFAPCLYDGCENQYSSTVGISKISSTRNSAAQLILAS